MSASIILGGSWNPVLALLDGGGSDIGSSVQSLPLHFSSAQHIVDANAPGIDMMSTGGDDEELDSEGSSSVISGIASMSQLLDLEERLLTPTLLSSRSQQRWILIK